MLILNCDTATSYVSAGITELLPDTSHENPLGYTLSEVESMSLYEPRGHMETLVPLITECLGRADLRPADLDLVITGIGPGPFTGLRVGMATAQAMAQALGIPVHGVGTLEAIAQNAQNDPEALSADLQDESLLVITDARRKEWFVQQFDLATQLPSSDPEVVKPEEFVKRFTKAVVISDVFAADPSTLPSGWRVLGSAESYPSALGISETCIDAIDPSELFTTLLEGTPALRAEYLRRPDAAEPQKKAQSSALDFSGIDDDR